MVSQKTKTATRRKPTRRLRPPRRVAVAPPAGAIVSPDTVVLVRTKGSPRRGGGPNGESWRIDVGSHRAGVVFINVVDEPALGPHASIQIFLNAASRGRQIGRVAYRKACEASAFDVVYAHMRKSNLASRRAAEEAGFVDIALPAQGQLLMVRRRA